MNVRLESNSISDWESFHETCRKLFGFPDFYGMNMDAWIDCLTYIDEGDGMSAFHLSAGEVLNVEVADAQAFKDRVPEIFEALVEAVAFVNNRFIARDISTRISLTFL